MQLSEIKNDLATINYSPEINRLMLSDFILIEDSNQSILAQIISIEATMEEDVNSAMLKFLLSIDKDANLTQYSGYVPAKNASIILINPEEVVQLIKGNDKNVYIGNLAAYNDVPVELNLDFLRKKTYIQVDFVENKLQIVETILRGLEKNNKKTILIDFQGLYEGISLPTVTLGYNFKLPLNYEALCYIAEEELNDCDKDNKAVLQGILIEVQNYVKSIQEEFIPFDTLISVLDAQYDEDPIPELLLLKNKLLKYQQQGIFANDKSEFDFLDTFLKDARNFKFDLSELPSQWHKIAFASILNIIKAKCYLIAEFSDDNSNKTIIRKLYDKTDIKPIVISSYEYKYQLQLKAMSKNMILFKPLEKVNDFAGYTSFLNILSQDTFIVWGEQTLFIPLIIKTQSFYKTEQKLNIPKNKPAESEVQPIEDIREVEQIESADLSDYPTEDLSDSSNEQEPDIEAEFETSYEEPIYNTNNEPEIVEEDVSDESIPEETAEEVIPAESISEEIVEETIPDETTIGDSFEENSGESVKEVETFSEDLPNEDDLPTEDDLDFFFDNESETSEEIQSLETPQELSGEMLEEITEQLENNSEKNTAEETNISEELSIEAIDVVDESNITEETNPEIEQESQEENIQEEEIVENLEDINIDENILENDETAKEAEVTAEPDETSVETDIQDTFEEMKESDTAEAKEIQETGETEKADESSEEEIVLPKVSEPKEPAIPVYTTNVSPQFDTKFAQGTYVQHPKYGRGTVEKVINYGSKELCLVIFDNEGRKLLDPNLADLKQL